MKRLILTIFLTAALGGVHSADDPTDKAPAKEPAAEPAKEPAKAKGPNSNITKVSYAMGLSIGSKMKADQLDIHLDSMISGIRDSLAGTPKIKEPEMREILMKHFQKLQARQMAEAQQTGMRNLEEGKVFLEANKKKKGVVTLASGLQYTVIKEGTGRYPTANDTVTTHYRGTLLSGVEFDSSYERNKPAVFRVGQVIKGWTEALQLMKVGGKWQLFIPAELAYGSRPRPGGPIGPNAVLIFDIELISIK